MFCVLTVILIEAPNNRRRSFFFSSQKAGRHTGGQPKIALDPLCLKDATLCLFAQLYLVLSGFAYCCPHPSPLTQRHKILRRARAILFRNEKYRAYIVLHSGFRCLFHLCVCMCMCFYFMCMCCANSCAGARNTPSQARLKGYN